MVKIKINNEGSKSFEVNKTDWYKVGKGALIALAGAVIVFLTTYLGDIDFGNYTLFVGAIASGLVNFLRQWVKDNK